MYEGDEDLMDDDDYEMAEDMYDDQYEDAYEVNPHCQFERGRDSLSAGRLAGGV
jgi:hypothetical protein